MRTIAQEFSCQSAVFSLDNPDAIQNALTDVFLVVNLAGLFQLTQQPLIEACLATGCHYIDIASEVEEMRSTIAFADSAQAAGVMLMPGAGFGVVPTDIVANVAKELLPDATDHDSLCHGRWRFTRYAENVTQGHQSSGGAVCRR